MIFNVATVRPQSIDPNIIRIIVKSTVLYDPNTIVTDASTIRAKVFTLLEEYNSSYVGQFLCYHLEHLGLLVMLPLLIRQLHLPIHVIV